MEALDRLAPLVKRDLWRAAVSVASVTRKPERYLDKEKDIYRDEWIEIARHDLVLDWREIATDLRGRQHLNTAIDHGIGLYEDRCRCAKWEIFNPLVWLAWILRIPIFILDRAGFSPEESQPVVGRAVGWAMQGLVLLILTLIAAKFGLSIPWEKLPSFPK